MTMTTAAEPYVWGDLDADGFRFSWTPGMYPACGTLVVETRVGRKVTACTYLVTEVPVPERGGRTFHLFKSLDTPGTDAEADRYDCLIGTGPVPDSCDCRGFLRWQARGVKCKHLLALRHLTDGGRL